MVELDDAMRRALLAREDPPLGARAEVLGSLRSRLSGPGDPDSGESGSGDLGELGSGVGEATTGAQLPWAAKVVAATFGLTASGLLALKLGALAVGAIAGDEAPREPKTEIVAPQAIAEPPERSEDSTTPAPEVGAASQQDLEPEPNHRSTAGEPSDSIETSELSESTLAAELVLVRAAKQARPNDREAALTQLDLHRSQFPTGVLAPEREALRIELLCELDRRAEADRARERFLVDFAGSPLRGRVLASCSDAGMDSSDAGD